ncbi:MAG: DsbE family thiol:disulfide interchange protein [Hydrogenophaga sp.]|nr:DsbE family thiol:disulfide interchange protein [Hydrogenophaga sp.]
MKRFLWPLLVFVGLVALLGAGLMKNPREVPSPLVGRSAPSFSLPTLADPAQQLGPEQLRGRVWVLNVWASWCVACEAEHPVLVDMARRTDVTLVGLNYKDKREAALVWLGRHGNPYRASLLDADGRVGLDLGVYGVPETYVIDRDGVIRHKHTGAVTPEVVQGTLLPLIRQLEG